MLKTLNLELIADTYWTQLSFIFKLSTYVMTYLPKNFKYSKAVFILFWQTFLSICMQRIDIWEYILNLYMWPKNEHAKHAYL